MESYVIHVRFEFTLIFFTQNLEKISDVKPNEDPSSWSGNILWGQADMTKLIDYFRTYSVDAPKK